ncbi:hypothetical protein AJ78_06534 [Emergomyces pasteurianus Ep9510]|uniref:Chromo domain-containing protein n=1 Tax=Emergomyces pasteurianus Ep9510 TaxID=1447872 RepID=A0A1J9PAG8_9EURO|nr:hypothetical protein AJ78_06534 [Emergomyces pasteurianus Ep9510]
MGYPSVVCRSVPPQALRTLNTLDLTCEGLQTQRACEEDPSPDERSARSKEITGENGYNGPVASVPSSAALNGKWPTTALNRHRRPPNQNDEHNSRIHRKHHACDQSDVEIPDSPPPVRQSTSGPVAPSDVGEKTEPGTRGLSYFADVDNVNSHTTLELPAGTTKHQGTKWGSFTNPHDCGRRTTTTRPSENHQHTAFTPEEDSNSENNQMDNSNSNGANSLLGQHRSPPPPMLVERNGVETKEWLVDEIINSKIVCSTGKMRLKYLVGWKGYQPTWQLCRDLILGCKLLINEFHKKHPSRPSPADLDAHKRSKRSGRPISGGRPKRLCLKI